jgi:hypothetical protein
MSRTLEHRPSDPDEAGRPQAPTHERRLAGQPAFGEPISVYTRAQAIGDGALVAVDQELASNAGFVLPVALTCAVYEDCVAWTQADTRDTGVVQDQTGRLWDVLTMAAHAARRARGNNRVSFQLYRVPRNHARIPIDDLDHLDHLDDHQRDALCLVTLVLHCGPGDAGEPVLTILQPGED